VCSSRSTRTPEAPIFSRRRLRPCRDLFKSAGWLRNSGINALSDSLGPAHFAPRTVRATNIKEYRRIGAGQMGTRHRAGLRWSAGLDVVIQDLDGDYKILLRTRCPRSLLPREVLERPD